MSTHVNAYKAELEDSLTTAEKALGEVRSKYQAFVSKLEEHTGPVEQINQGVTPVVGDKPVDKVTSVEPVDKPVAEPKDSTKAKVEGQK